MNPQYPIMRVSAKIDTKVLAGDIERAIARLGEQNKPLGVELRAIGAGAVNQMVKASIIALDRIEAQGLQGSWVPEYVTIVELDRTGIRVLLSFEPDRPGSHPGGVETNFLVSAESKPGSVAGRIAHTVRENCADGSIYSMRMQGLGAPVVNTMTKAAIIAANMLSNTNHWTSWRPIFFTDPTGIYKNSIQLCLLARA